MNRKRSMEELQRISTSEFKEAEKIPVIVILDNIRSASNVGSVFRTSDAFRIKKVYLCGITATPPHREIQKTALGATESVEWKYFNNTLEAVEKVREEGFFSLAVEQTTHAISLENFPWEDHPQIALIFGNEVTGVSDEIISLADGAVEIPQGGTKHSLNISVCAGIILWDVYRKLIVNLNNR